MESISSSLTEAHLQYSAQVLALPVIFISFMYWSLLVLSDYDA